MGFVLDRLAMGQVFLLALRFSRVCIISYKSSIFVLHPVTTNATQTWQMLAPLNKTLPSLHTQVVTGQSVMKHKEVKQNETLSHVLCCTFI